MKMVLSGGEKGTYRNTLVENKVPCIALNITQFNIPKKKEVSLRELMGGAEVYVYTSDEDEDVAKFDEFIRTHVDDLECIIGRSDYDGTWLGDKYVPLWNDDQDLERLAHLCQKYGRVAISDRALTAKTIPRIRQLQQRWGCVLVGLTSKVDMIEALPWDVVIVSSWTSVVRYGETQVWDGHGLRRYPAQRKESSRKSQRQAIIRLGVDYEAVLEDDVKEVAKLAVLSWLEWGKTTLGIETPAAYHPFEDVLSDDEDEVQTGQVVAISPNMPDAQSGSRTPVPIAIEPPRKRGQNDKQLLPVIGVEEVVSVGSHNDSNGEDTYEIDPQREDVLRYKSSGLRQCDSCYLAPRCPRFEEHTECAYELPVEMKTKKQLNAVLTAMLEMQTSRILFARFAEELEGQGNDPTLSAEMDRLFRLTKEFKDIEDTRDMVRFEVEARAGAGVLSRIFGEKAADKANPLSSPLSAPQLDQFILDAEVLDER